MSQNVEFDHHRICNAAVVTLPPFLEFEYLERYPTCSDVGLSPGVQVNEYELPVPELLDKRCEIAVAKKTKRWIYLGGRSALGYH